MVLYGLILPLVLILKFFVFLYSKEFIYYLRFGPSSGTIPQRPL